MEKTEKIDARPAREGSASLLVPQTMYVVRVRMKVIDPRAVIPVCATPGAAGMDLVAMEGVTVASGDVVTVPCGFAVELPEGCYFMITSRSGLAKNGIVVANAPGIVDSDYRGEVKVLLTNVGRVAYRVHGGDKVAQMILHRFQSVQWYVSKSLSGTERGEGGFGSTGR